MHLFTPVWAFISLWKLAPTVFTGQETANLFHHDCPSLSMYGMSWYLMLLLAHCCMASLTIFWDRCCAKLVITLAFEGSFTSSLTQTGKGFLDRNLSSNIKLSLLAFCFSLSSILGIRKVCFDFMQPMVWWLKGTNSRDYFSSIFGKTQVSMQCWLACSLSRLLQKGSSHHSPQIAFSCQEKESFVLKSQNIRYWIASDTWRQVSLPLGSLLLLTIVS